MNKEFLVVLLKKDIRELALLTQGFEEMTDFPEPILILARQKAEAVLESLNGLTNSVKDPEPKLVDETPLVTEIKQEEVFITDAVEAEPADEEDAAQYVEDIIDYGLSNSKSTNETIPEIETSENKVEVEEYAQEKPVEAEVASEFIQEQVESIEEEEEEVVDDSSSVNDRVKVVDIKNAINIGDRFRFQRELFGGNGEVMNKTIAYLNQLAKYDEAISFLKNKFGWDKNNQHAEDFYKIIRRRYL